MDYKIEYFQKFNDNRGELVVFLRNSNLEQEFKKFGQIYLVSFRRKNVVRGNHYHKNIREWFGIVHGKVEAILKDLKTNETKKMILDSGSSKYIRLEIGTNIAHAFRCLSSKASLLNYANREWSKADTHIYKLI